MAQREPLGRVLVIIPTYNEVANLENVLTRLRAAVPGVEVLVVDDNSPDGTGALADRLAAENDHLYVLHRPAKADFGTAYLDGFAWGLDRGYGVLVEIEADGSYRPEDLPMMLQRLETADMVKGSRWVRGGAVINVDKRRELLSRAGNLWIQLAMNMPVHDSTGGFNAYRASMLRRIDLSAVQGRGYTVRVDLIRRVLEAGGRIVEVPVEFMEREFGVSKLKAENVSDAIRRTTRWGMERRSSQAQALADKVRGASAQLMAHRTPNPPTQ